MTKKKHESRDGTSQWFRSMQFKVPRPYQDAMTMGVIITLHETETKLG
jgi:hypothetical protein